MIELFNFIPYFIPNQKFFGNEPYLHDLLLFY